MKEIHEMMFRLNGGWVQVFVSLMFKTFEWVGIGFLVHLGWRLAS